MESPFDCRFYRRFGIELELNPLNGVVRRPNTDSGEIPVGADYVCMIVRKTTGEYVELQGWDHVNNNNYWIVKPDNSCGIEVNSPVLKGWEGLRKVMKVEDSLKEGGLNSDKRCSLHVHVNISDLSPVQLASVIAHYIKCEHIFFDSIPPHRKNNRYCQLLGMTDLFSHDFHMDPLDLINLVSGVKYYSMNCYHFCKGGGFAESNQRKRTIEFRIMEGKTCLDSFSTKNWVRLLLHFVEVTSKLPLPQKYQAGDKWSSLLWLDPKDLFEILHFDKSDLLSPGLKQVRDWFLGRLLQYGYDTGLSGIWSNKGRFRTRKDILDLANGLEPVVADDPIYGRNYVT